MEQIINFMRSDTFLIISTSLIFLLIIGYVINIIKLKKLRNGYKLFMKKLGNGKDVQEDLMQYITRVEQTEENINKIINYCKQIEDKSLNCIQKIGIVRYSAFKDTGSDLSFAVALLDDKNNGVIFNGIYSREMSNIYAKPVQNGKSSYTLIKEEQEAIEKAMNA